MWIPHSQLILSIKKAFLEEKETAPFSGRQNVGLGAVLMIINTESVLLTIGIGMHSCKHTHRAGNTTSQNSLSIALKGLWDDLKSNKKNVHSPKFSNRENLYRSSSKIGFLVTKRNLF